MSACFGGDVGDPATRLLAAAICGLRRRAAWRTTVELSAVVRPSINDVFDLAYDRRLCAAVANALVDALPLARPFAQHLRWRFADPALPYHDAAHIGLLWLRHMAHGGSADDLGTALAIVFHDAVYDPARSDNEARSADLLHAAVAPMEEVAWAAAAIRATADHLGYVGNDPRVLRVLDLDLTPLAERAACLRRNTRALRRESAALTDSAWTASQHRTLTGLLSHTALFRSGLGPFYEAPARRNMARLLRPPTVARRP